MSEYIVRETGYPGQLKQEIVGELVRCKDCKHYGDDHFCCYPWCTTPENFCSRGERRE